MITIQKQLDLPDTYPLERIGSLSELLFFDIETTGFSGDYNNLYLIGCTYYEDGHWNLIQWFADTAESEPELLHAFFKFLSKYHILIHFNGDGFDIPFLLKRCKYFGLSYDFQNVVSYDIYKRIKPYRKLLGLDSLKQKSIEEFLGIHRQDKYSGGQLIDVYKDYLITHEDFLYDLLILHNEDDLKGMPAILPILNYPDLLESNLSFVDSHILEQTDLFGDTCHQLEIVSTSPYAVPVPFSFEHNPVSCQISDHTVNWTIDLYDGTLKHFFPNYRDYYYLVYEDTAIHKSVGEFVDKDARVKATAKTCYTKKEGCFVPQFESLWEPVMKLEPTDKVTYAPLENICLNDEKCFHAYIGSLFRHFGVK